MTRVQEAQNGRLTDEVKQVASDEGLSPEDLSGHLADGHAVITRNIEREDIKPLGIGSGLSVKINANLGTSRDAVDVQAEIEKAKVALEAGADTVMDLSTGGDLADIRRKIMQAAPVPLGTVPIYEAAARALPWAADARGRTCVKCAGAFRYAALAWRR